MRADSWLPGRTIRFYHSGAMARPDRAVLDAKTLPAVGHNLASRAGEQDRNGTGKFMLRLTWASARVVRVCAFGLAATSAAVLITTSTAEARHSRHRVHVSRHHHEEHDSYNPQFSSIIVDANSGATLESNSPD